MMRHWLLLVLVVAPVQARDDLPVPLRPPARAAAMPHATHSVSLDDFGYDREAYSLDRFAGWPDQRLWEVLRPPWLVRAERQGAMPQSEDGARAFIASLSETFQWAEATRGRWVSDLRNRPLRLRYRLSRDGTVVLSGTEQVLPGVAAVISDVYHRLRVLDYEPEIAMGATISQPEVGVLFAGTSLAVDVLPIPGHGWQAAVAVVDSRAGPDESVALGYPEGAALDRLRQRLREFGATTVLRPGEPVTMTFPGIEGSTFDEVELEISGGLPADSVSRSSEVVCVAAPTLLDAPAWKSRAWDADFKHDSGYLGFEGPTAVGRAQVAVEAARERARTVPLELVATRTLPGGESRVVARMRLDAVPGSEVQFAGGGLVNALVAWEVDVATAARIPDPVVARYFSGLRGRLTPSGGGDGPSSVVMKVDLTEVRVGGATTLELGAPMPAIATTQDGRRAEVGPQSPIRVTVERPELAQQSIDGVFETDADGRIVVERGWADSSLGRLRLELSLGGE